MKNSDRTASNESSGADAPEGRRLLNSPTDANGYAVGYVSTTEQVCVTIEVHAGGVTLRETPTICFP